MRFPTMLSRSQVGYSLIILVSLLALAFRFIGLEEKSLWLDEAWSWRAASLSFADMVDWTADDRHPPLYYAVLSVAVDVFGDSEATLRLPSAVASAATAGLIAWVGWRVGGPMLGLLAGGLLAVHPTSIEFAQEARMYPLVGLLALASTVCVAAIVEKITPLRIALYTLLASSLLYTHYSGMLVLALHAALATGYAVARWRTDGRSIALAACGAILVALLTFAPWYGNFMDSANAGVSHLAPASWRLADLVGASLFGLQRAEGLWLAVALPLSAFGVYGIARRASDPYVACTAALATVPCMQLAITWLRTPVLDARQASPYIAGVVFIMALGAVEGARYVADLVARDRIAHPATVGLGAALATLMLWAASDWYRAGPREDWREAARIIDARGGDTLIWRGYIDVPLRYYTDAPTKSAEPAGQGPPAATRTLILSHHTAQERAAILPGLAASFETGEPLLLPGIEVVPLSASASP